MENLKFKLIQGKRLALHGLGMVITNANLTNENALEVLRRAPGAIKFFETYPTNWREMTMAKTAAPKPAAEKPTAAPVAPPPFKVSEIDLEKTRRDNLQGKGKKQLREMCQSFEIPEDEYAGKSKGELIELLMAKTA